MDLCWTSLSYLASILMVSTAVVLFSGKDDVFPIKSHAASVRKWYEDDGGSL